MPSYCTHDGQYAKCALFGMQGVGCTLKSVRAHVLEMSGSGGSWKGAAEKKERYWK